ncbi:putative disease resistance protein RGA3 [Magnolia sinica]|uniref:putative disease resistance protein RGA3 n=1 Tax=Magnolia sinica TaxID=86752 RepID=UPI00265B04A7|nr:putative disease resistance protein RGA3 [Magnolia sinica]XP_058108276.1 putative disease resistance protein RGA3 [Magnolia sinica]
MADGLVSSVLNYLNSIIQSELGSVLSCRQDLQDLSSEFTAIQAVLHDAEKRQRKDEALSDWLAKLKDAAYDVEDVLDRWRAEALGYEAEASGRPSFTKRVCNSLLQNLNIDEKVSDMGIRVKLGIAMGRKLNNVREKLKAICNEKSKFHLEEIIDSKMETAERKTSSLIDEPEIIGRTSDKERIIPWLVSDSSRVSYEIPVISIIGSGGIGKTALAQLIYNDERVTQHFSKRLWVHVSDDFNETRICKAIVEAADGQPAPSFSEWEMVQNHLWNVLKGERFLLVLDDIWNENQEKWDKLRLPLKGGVSGSRILITTRNEAVVKTMRATKWHELAPLLEIDSWSLFSHIAFGEINTEERAESEEIGKEIARKCDGIPLIIKRIANALRFKRTRREWELLLDSETWDFPDVRRGIIFDLQLSYENMPPYLKRCFAFCSVFPKDHVIERETLIKLWMAQGFIHSAESAVMESKGDEYFYNLLGRCLFDAPITDCFGNIMHCKMIDIVHDFFQTVMRECYTMNMELSNNIPLHVRHVSLKCSDDLSSIPGNLCKAKNLRTLLFIGWSRITVLADDFFENFRCLRALDLSGTNCSHLPKSSKNLKLLRYLNLSTSGVELLPEFICELYLLQTLKLNACRGLSKLPKTMWKLARLRHLETESTWQLRTSPHWIGRLTSLRTLSKFIVGEGMECRIGELKNLNLLQGKLTIYHLERVLNEGDAKEAELMNKKHLRSLELYFDDRLEEQSELPGRLDMLARINVTINDGVLEGLRPHTNLEELNISSYMGLKFPRWMEDASFSNLVNVTLRNCHDCIKLPALGTLSSLKYLAIAEMTKVEFIGLEFYGKNDSRDVTGAAAAFPKLETLVLDGMYSLREWVGSEDGGMPSLLELRIAKCPMLMKMPLFLHGKLWKVDIELPSNYWTSCISESVECLVVDGGFYIRDMLIINNDGIHIRDIDMIHLPSSCKYLVIKNSPYFEFPIGIRKLCGLQILHITGCRRLTHLPKELRDLCNLRELKIKDCPSLEEWCENYAEDGQQAMSHIPNIWIGNQEIKRDGQSR